MARSAIEFGWMRATQKSTLILTRLNPACGSLFYINHRSQDCFHALSFDMSRKCPIWSQMGARNDIFNRAGITTWSAMITLLSPHYVLQETTEDDMNIASLAWGFTIGFGWLTTWTALKQTMQVYKGHGLCVFRNAYVWMVWLEIFVCLVFSIICWLHLRRVIPPRLVLIDLRWR